ncbi:hypothetical protein QBC43DRAFT_287688 [Cladorrhinum sp. PSN259]|nr:hypothetical protein QBC43DRAFT_287688 [Cladorrhinum sp. PSN259]
MSSCNLYNGSKVAFRWFALGLGEEIKGNFSSTSTSTHNEAYNEINEKAGAAFKPAFHRSQLGNPAKGAEGRELPEFLTLGGDATEEIGKACRKILNALQE